MRVNILQQRTPIEIGGEYVANLAHIRTVEADSMGDAIKEAKKWTVFRVAQGLSRFPIAESDGQDSSTR